MSRNFTSTVALQMRMMICLLVLNCRAMAEIDTPFCSRSFHLGLVIGS